MEVIFINLSSGELPCSELELQQMSHRIFQSLKSRDVEVSPSAKQVTFVLADEALSANLNQRFCKKPGPTDVLSFQGISADSLGEVVVCKAKLVAQAQANRHAETEELLYLFLHAILHLLGYEHELERIHLTCVETGLYVDPTQKAAEMLDLQDEIFEELRSS